MVKGNRERFIIEMKHSKSSLNDAYSQPYGDASFEGPGFNIGLPPIKNSEIFNFGNKKLSLMQSLPKKPSHSRTLSTQRSPVQTASKVRKEPRPITYVPNLTLDFDENIKWQPKLYSTGSYSIPDPAKYTTNSTRTFLPTIKQDKNLIDQNDLRLHKLKEEVKRIQRQRELRNWAISDYGVSKENQISLVDLNIENEADFIFKIKNKHIGKTNYDNATKI